MDPMWKKIVEALVSKHGCHTIVAYGSRARDGGTEESDYDVLGFCTSGSRQVEAREFEGEFLDAHIYPDSDPERDLTEFLRLRGGVVLVEKNDFGKTLLRRLDEFFAAGPPVLSADQRELRRTWIRKMLIRIVAGDVEAHYRRAWLLTQLLEDYFVLRGKWFLGSKESFRWLAENDKAALAFFEAALEPGATNASVKRLAGYVLDSK